MSGCAYKGQLKSGFYSPTPNANKMPLKAELVSGPSFEAGEFAAKNIYYSHSVTIKTHPALKQALVDTCQSVFASVSVVSSVNAENPNRADVLVLPNIEMKESVLTLTVALKNPNTGDLIQQYQSSGNIKVRAPASVHIIGTLNALVCGALSPIVAPSITQILGGRGERELKERLTSCLRACMRSHDMRGIRPNGGA